jgi:hypothetical protein
MTKEKVLAIKSLHVLKMLIEACDNDGPVYQALENCRYALLEIIEE